MNRREIKKQAIDVLPYVTFAAILVLAFTLIKILRQQNVQIAQLNTLINQQKGSLRQAHADTEAALDRVHKTQAEQVEINTCQLALLGRDRSAVVTRAQFNACIKDTSFAPSAPARQSGADNQSTSGTAPSSAQREPEPSVAATVPARQSTNPPTKTPAPTAPPEPPTSNPQPPAGNPQPAAHTPVFSLGVGKLLTLNLL